MVGVNYWHISCERIIVRNFYMCNDRSQVVSPLKNPLVYDYPEHKKEVNPDYHLSKLAHINYQVLYILSLICKFSWVKYIKRKIIIIRLSFLICRCATPARIFCGCKSITWSVLHFQNLTFLCFLSPWRKWYCNYATIYVMHALCLQSIDTTKSFVKFMYAGHFVA